MKRTIVAMFAFAAMSLPAFAGVLPNGTCKSYNNRPGTPIGAATVKVQSGDIVSFKSKGKSIPVSGSGTSYKVGRTRLNIVEYDDTSFIGVVNVNGNTNRMRFECN